MLSDPPSPGIFLYKWTSPQNLTLASHKNDVIFHIIDQIKVSRISLSVTTTVPIVSSLSLCSL